MRAKAASESVWGTPIQEARPPQILEASTFPSEESRHEPQPYRYSEEPPIGGILVRASPRPWRPSAGLQIAEPRVDRGFRC